MYQCDRNHRLLKKAAIVLSLCGLWGTSNALYAQDGAQQEVPIAFGGSQGWSGAQATATGNTIQIRQLSASSASGVNLYGVTASRTCRQLVVHANNHTNFLQADKKFFKVDEQSVMNGQDDNRPPSVAQAHPGDPQYTVVGPGPFLFNLTPFDAAHPVHKLTLVFWQATIAQGASVQLELTCK